LDRIDEAREALQQAIAWTGGKQAFEFLQERLARM
jgi:predicted RNA polymerase sigma factor